MAVAFKGANYSDYTVSNGPATTVNIGATNAASAFPVGISAGDMLLATISVGMSSASDPGAISVTGFTTLNQAWDSTAQTRTWIGYRVAVGGDTASFAASWTSACRGASWGLASYSGADSGSPTFSAAWDTTADTNMIAPTVTPVTSTDVLVCIWGQFGSSRPYAAPGSMTLRADVSSTSSTVPEVMIADEQLASASATGTRTATQTNSNRSYGASIILTVPAAGGTSTSATFMMMGV